MFSLTLDSILQPNVPRKIVATFYLNYFLLLLWKFSDQMISLDYYHPWFPWSSFTFQPVSFGQWNVVGFCREIDNVFGAVRTCFDHVLSKFSGFSWERILFLKSACVNMVMQIQVQIGDTGRLFFMNPPWSVEDLKKLHFAWDSEDTFYGFWFTLRKR